MTGVSTWDEEQEGIGQGIAVSAPPARMTQAWVPTPTSRVPKTDSRMRDPSWKRKAPIAQLSGTSTTS